MPKPFAVADCETDPFKLNRTPQPFLWGLYFPDTKQYFQFENIHQLMDYIKGQDLRVYFHNGGKFDFHYMLEYVPSWEKVIVINGRLAQWRWHNIEFCDSYCILPVSLDTYKKTKVDYSIFEKENRDKPENKKVIEAYLKDDCVFLSELIQEFLNTNGYALTIASSAIKKLQKIEQIKVTDSGRLFFEEIRPYYYGGRVECFKKGLVKGTIHYFDINSAYPYAMIHEHPIEDFITTYESNPEILGHNFYKFQCKSFGAFPFRNEDKSLFFPADGKERIFCCTGWELLAAQEFNLLKGIIHIEQKIFLQTKNFKKYVDHYYTIKSTSKKGSPENIFSKLYLNSAYGKFAADPEKYKTTYFCDIEDFGKALIGGFNIHGELHGRLIISKNTDEENWRHYNVATGASITGFVRAYLFKALKSVQTPIYCDTDSIIFKGKHSLQLSNDLGAWKREGTFTEGGIGGKKIYCFRDKSGDEKIACKGLRANYNEILKVCKGEKLIKTPEVPIYSIKKGIYFQEKTIAMT